MYYKQKNERDFRIISEHTKVVQLVKIFYSTFYTHIIIFNIKNQDKKGEYGNARRKEKG